MRKALFVYNPFAGQLQIKGYLWDILNIFSKADLDLKVHATTEKRDAFNFVRDHAKDADLVICSGGDGTLNEVVNGMMTLEEKDRVPIGYIPAGTTNDYASSLKLSKNMRSSAIIAVNGVDNAYDIGKINDGYFVYVAAFGLFSEVSYATDQQMKNLLGHFAYVIEGARSLSTLKSYHLKIRTNDREIEGDYIYGMITNSLQVGGIYKMDEKDVKLDDGLLEVLLVRQPKKISDLNAINNFIFNLEDSLDVVESFKTDHIIIETEDQMEWAIDGEKGGPHKVTEITAVNKAIRVIS